MRPNDPAVPAEADKSLFEIMMEMTAEEWDALGDGSERQADVE